MDPKQGIFYLLKKTLMKHKYILFMAEKWTLSVLCSCVKCRRRPLFAVWVSLLAKSYPFSWGFLHKPEAEI